MLTGQSLVYFAPGPWQDLWRNRHQLMSVLSRQNKVLYVERRPYLRSTLSALQRGKLRWRDIFRPHLSRVTENLYVFRYPLWAPICGIWGLRGLTRAVRRTLLRSTLARLGLTTGPTGPIVWYAQPDMLDLLDAVPSPALRIYHVVDEYSAYQKQTHEVSLRTQARERQMLARVDAVIVVSQGLYQAKRPYNAHTYLVPNAVNYELFQAALADPELPPELAAIPEPRVGYIGLVGEKVDLVMLRHLAEVHPEWSLVFLGTVRLNEQAETWQAMRALPNVHLLDTVPASRVPDYVKGFQVGLLPYRLDPQVQNSSPLKMYDYLAAGIPIASVDMLPVRPFASFVQIASTPDDFTCAVRDALADSSPQRNHERQQIAARETWEARVETLSAIIIDRIGNRAAIGPPDQLGYAGGASDTCSPSRQRPGSPKQAAMQPQPRQAAPPEPAPLVKPATTSRS